MTLPLPRHRLLLSILTSACLVAATAFAAKPEGAKPAPAVSPTSADLPFSIEVRQPGQRVGFTLHHPADWSPSQRQFKNAVELRGPDEPEVNGKKADRARLLVRTEPRPSHEEAVERLRQLASRYPSAEIEYTEIGGWPALYTTHEKALQRPGEARAKDFLYGSTLVTEVAIAVDDSLVILSGDIPSKNRAVIDVVRSMAKGLTLDRPGDPAKAERHLESLRAQPRIPAKQLPPPAVDDGKALSSQTVSAGNPQQIPFADVAGAESTQAGASGLVRDVETNSEMEVVASTSGKYIVVATHRTYSSSIDGGLTFTPNIINTPNDGGADTVGYNANGDSSLGFGQSGKFYYAFIAYPDGLNTPPAGDVVDACTTAIVRSTDNGQTFSHRGHAAYCARIDPGASCFPDQEHIAVDRWNSSAVPDDQIYNTWRNFDFADAKNCNQLGSGNPDVYLTCSVDGGATFNNGGPAPIVSTGGPQGTAPVVVDTGGDFPRIAVGQDGFVYVVYMAGDSIQLAKYSPCAAGLAFQSSTTVSGSFAIDCQIAGLDRCNDGNDLRSPTVAVDDTDSSHVFVGFASDAPAYPAGTASVWACDSTDGGFSFPYACAIVNKGSLTTRYMPWTCSVCGEAFEGWYDRRFAQFTDNSLTDYFLGRAHRDPVNGLLAGSELRVSPISDSECGAYANGNWPCAPRAANDSENCTQQPQLAGSCLNDNGTPADTTDDFAQAGNPRCDFSDCGGANTLIDFGVSTSCQCTTAAGSPSQIYCATGGGCPKYGDYNGIACAAGRVYAAYASATPPGGPQDVGGDIDTFLLAQNICAPQINVPGKVNFTGGCSGGTISGTLNACNTGKADVEVDSVASSNAQFAVTTPTAGYPVVISPDFCFPLEVVFTSNGSPGTQTANLTINSNDPVNPALVVPVSSSANAGVPNIVTTIAPGGDFGNVFLGDIKDLDLTIQNSGGCPLTITNITSSNTEFKIGSVSNLPLVIEGGDSVSVPVRFQPANNNVVETANITIASDDPDTPSKVVAVTGGSPEATLSIFLANNYNFGNVCADNFHDLDVTVINDGACPAEVFAAGMTGTNPTDWQLPSGLLVVNSIVLEPQGSFQFPLRFAPTSFAAPTARSASLGVSARTLHNTVGVYTNYNRGVTGNVPPPDINVPDATPGTINFGNVCAGVIAEREIPVCNTGKCNLDVTSATLLNGCDDFTIVANPFPTVVSPDFCIPVKVQYTPTEAGPHVCTLRIISDDPDESPIDITLLGNTPPANIDVPVGETFLPEVVQTVDNCSTKKLFPISNNGSCPLVITDVSILVNPDEYSLDGLPSFSIPVAPGHLLGEGDLGVVFAPDQPLGREKVGEVAVTYESDPVTHATTVATVDLCGEGVLTGARVLVTYNGSNFGTVDRIQIQRIVGNRNRRPQLDTVAVNQNVPLTQFVHQPENDFCADFYYHKEYGTVSNPIQLVPGYYQVTATITVGGKRRAKTVAFSVNACDFNPTVVVTF